jgi:transcriptional regulator of arginine metabolism
MNDKLRRWQRLRDHIRRGGVQSQDQLASILRREGIEVTQATLSRDLRDLGVMKGPAGYVLPENAGAANPSGASCASPMLVAPVAAVAELETALRNFLLRAEAGGTIVVLHTGPGQASFLAGEIDKAVLRNVLGTVAGDDTVLVATRNPKASASILGALKQLAGLR